MTRSRMTAEAAKTTFRRLTFQNVSVGMGIPRLRPGGGPPQVLPECGLAPGTAARVAGLRSGSATTRAAERSDEPKRGAPARAPRGTPANDASPRGRTTGKAA